MSDGIKVLKEWQGALEDCSFLRMETECNEKIGRIANKCRSGEVRGDICSAIAQLPESSDSVKEELDCYVCEPPKNDTVRLVQKDSAYKIQVSRIYDESLTIMGGDPTHVEIGEDFEIALSRCPSEAEWGIVISFLQFASPLIMKATSHSDQPTLKRPDVEVFIKGVVK